MHDLPHPEKYILQFKFTNFILISKPHIFSACGCLPLVPNRLVYPELYPKDPCIYNTDTQLYKKLKSFCRRPNLIREKKTIWTEDIARNICEKFSAENLSSQYIELFQS